MPRTRGAQCADLGRDPDAPEPTAWSRGRIPSRMRAVVLTLLSVLRPMILATLRERLGSLPQGSEGRTPNQQVRPSELRPSQNCEVGLDEDEGTSLCNRQETI